MSWLKSLSNWCATFSGIGAPKAGFKSWRKESRSAKLAGVMQRKPTKSECAKRPEFGRGHALVNMMWSLMALST